ncbi:MAG TPA: hypothetical protein PKO34_03400 [Smithellaceae bacterium]|nr:hypothetical protein [Smithellaceae bacterium]
MTELFQRPPQRDNHPGSRLSRLDLIYSCDGICNFHAAPYKQCYASGINIMEAVLREDEKFVIESFCELLIQTILGNIGDKRNVV